MERKVALSLCQQTKQNTSVMQLSALSISQVQDIYYTMFNDGYNLIHHVSDMSISELEEMVEAYANDYNA